MRLILIFYWNRFERNCHDPGAANQLIDSADIRAVFERHPTVRRLNVLIDDTTVRRLDSSTVSRGLMSSRVIALRTGQRRTQTAGYLS
ncbi:hypothetical protein T5B8_05621 [Salinisphaera sp. T5B8]|uniref:hypothetical protein n=1 Tax=Salinisphaera sp. T5B8 TaxID=1304154 RepID=UPI00334143AB